MVVPTPFRLSAHPTLSFLTPHVSLERCSAHGWHRLEHRQAGRQRDPVGPVAVEDRHARVKARRIVERAGINGVGVARPDDSAEHQPTAGRAEVAVRLAAKGWESEGPSRPAETDGAGGKAHEADRA